MSDSCSDKSEDALTEAARACLGDLMECPGLASDQWFLRVSTKVGHGEWIQLGSDARQNNATIRGAIQLSELPVTDLALAFCGMANINDKDRFVVYTQYFQRGVDTGLVLGRRIKRTLRGRKLRTQGRFLRMGNCKNIWI